MYKMMIVDTFKVTETLQNGKERTTKKDVYSEMFGEVDGHRKFYGQDERIKDCIAVLKERQYYNIQYVGAKRTHLLFTERDKGSSPQGRIPF